MAAEPKDEGLTPSEPPKKPKVAAKPPAEGIAPADPARKPVARPKPAPTAEGITADQKPKPKAAPAEKAEGAEHAEGIAAEKKPKAKPAVKSEDADSAETAEGITTEKKPKKKAAASEAIATEPASKLKLVKARPGVWGIDIGQCALKAVRLETDEDDPSAIIATAFDYIEHPKILSQPDADPDQLTREALEKFLSRNPLRGDTVVIAVPGQSGLARFVKLPPVEEKKISEIVKFEAKQQIPFALEEVVWDFQKISSGLVTDGFALDTEIGLFAMKRDQIARSMQQFLDLAVEVHIVQMAPLALCNYVSFDLLRKEQIAEGGESGDRKCIVALDIGADGSSLVVTDGERIIWQRPIPLGGNHFTRALTKDLKLTFAKAEHVKRNATKSPDLKKILASLKPVLNDFVGEVQRSIGYFQNTHRNAELEYIIGLGNAFRLPGLQRYLEEKLQIPVRKVAKLERLTGDKVINEEAFTENVMTFAVAYGLGLQGLNRSRLTTNLLPEEIRTERLIRAKKPWAVASAAVLLLGLGSLVLGYGMKYRTYSDARVDKALTEAVGQADKSGKRPGTGGVKGKVDTNERTFTEKKGTALKEETAVKSVIAGQEEFVNWLEICKFVSDCVPQPNGDNLLAEGKRKEYFLDLPTDQRKTKMTGADAYKEFLKRQSGVARPADPVSPTMPPMAVGDPRGTPTAAKPADLGKGIADLIQINVEGVDSRYTEDLNAFWRHLRRNPNLKGNLRPLELEKIGFEVDNKFSAKGIEPEAPKVSGWIVEVRGFTFHHRGKEFVMDTFVENIWRRGMPDFDATKPETTLPDKKGPVINHISHVVLFYGEPKEKTDDTMNFEMISTSQLDVVLKEAAAGAAGAGAGRGEGLNPSPGGMLTGSPRDVWVPANGAGSGGPLTGPIPGRPSPPVTGGTVTAGENRRTEFVIFFIWREPTPSDALRGLDKKDSAAGPVPSGPVGPARPGP